jgi:hypothetical protein
MRPRSIIIALISAVAVLVPVLPVSAAVGGTCSVVVPAKIRLDSPYEIITARLAADCDGSAVSYASWNVRHSYYGPSDIVIFDGSDSDSMGFYDWEHLGRYYVEPGGAYDSEYDELQQNTTQFTVKLGTRAYLTTSRSGRTVTLNARTTSYRPSVDAFRAWSSAKVTLQYKTCLSCAWKSLATLTTGTKGTASYRTTSTSARYYRAIAGETSSRWGRTSSTSRR